MGKPLIIIESINKIKTIQNFLNNDYKVIASGGHIKDLPSKSLGIDIEEGFAPKYVTLPKKTKEIAEIKKCASEADVVYLATDADREGEAIAWHVAEIIRSLGKKAPPIYRIRPNEISKKAFDKELAQPSQINQELYDSQQARRVLDRLVGYQISPILWDKVRRGLSAGRVQSVAVRLIVDRENAIRNYLKKEYWEILARLASQEGAKFDARLVADATRTIYSDATSVEKHHPNGVITSEQEAAAYVSQSLAAPFIVKKIEKKPNLTYPRPPFTTVEMCATASTQFRFKSSKTMSLAQKLFEGVDLGPEGATGLITYLRTDSVRISDDAAAQCRDYIKAQFGTAYLPAAPVSHDAEGDAEKKRKKKKEKDAQNIQDAHEAIRPTSVTRTPDAVKPYLTPDQYKLYTLIWRRFVASQMKPAISDVTTVRIENGALEYRVSGSVRVFDGYRRVMDDTKRSGDAETTEGDEGSDGKEKVLPPLREGETLTCRSVDKLQCFTQPPRRFTESALLTELKARQIGRPSTYAPTLSNIQDKGYVETVKNSLLPTELGELVTGLLIENFKNIMDIEFTADTEKKLDRIAMGEADWVQTLADFYAPFKASLDKASKDMRNVKTEAEKTNLTCDKCQSEMVIKWGKNGHFLACSNYPACKNTMEFARKEDGTIEPRQKTLEVKGTCSDCGKQLIVRTGKFGRFLACAGYPACKHTEPYPLDVACPNDGCDGKLVQKRTKRGKIFFGCNRYPDCTYSTWNEPTTQMCENCHESHLEIVRQARSSALLCPKCAFSKPLEPED
ncbi:MAG: type I DNA topoisomerase [Proteobacteria bacterium]|nr:type I DNA topoisomerase [Pseudomonadota bacterium]